MVIQFILSSMGSLATGIWALAMHLFRRLFFLKYFQSVWKRMIRFYLNLLIMFQLASHVKSIDRDGHAFDLLKTLIKRIEKSELKIDQLTARVFCLETELSQSIPSTSSLMTNERNCNSSTYTTASNDNSSTLSNTLIVPSLIPAPPPPPPPQSQPTIQPDNFKFASTPNPVFLSRGKLHETVLTKNNGKSAEMLQSRLQSLGLEGDIISESFMKSKKQRVLEEDLIQQKKLLRKIVNPGQTPLRGPNAFDPMMDKLTDLNIEDLDLSLNDLLKSALKRKFANVNEASSVNESLLTEENSEFSL